jgi:hypothetical protein
MAPSAIAFILRVSPMDRAWLGDRVAADGTQIFHT